MSEVFSFPFALISQSPAIIPFIEASLFIVAPFDEVRREHEFEIPLTAFAMNDVIILKPLKSAIKRFFVEIEHLSEIFPRRANKTSLLVQIQS